MKEEQLEVINEDDEVIGLESRETIHQKGLLHREIHVWFITPNREIIFQHRAKNKDTYPDKLDATVGGHVEPGVSYEETAVKECEEETGVKLDLLNLRLVYVYLFDDNISDLRVEEGKAIGFEAWRIDSLPSLSKQDQERFIPMILSKEFLDLFEEGQKILDMK